MRRTKVVATIGPSSDDARVLSAMIRAGMDVARLNLSHGTTDQHRERIRTIRRASRELNRELGIMLDLRGPEVRIGMLREPLLLEPGMELRLVRGNQGELYRDVTVTWDGLFSYASPGQVFLFDDGNLVTRCVGTDSDSIWLSVEVGGLLKSQKKISCPGSQWPLDPLAASDEDAILMGLEEAIDSIAVSFVRTADDIIRVRRFIEENGGAAPLIAKIEDPLALEHLDEILTVSDGIMVARGDLGVAMPLKEVPWLQKDIIQRANQAGIPVITATQMLESMVTMTHPTRAEASDVANAIWDGTDAVMLSAESASGQYPVEAVKTIAEIAEAADERAGMRRKVASATSRIADAVSQASATIADSVGAKAILSVTESGYTARMVSRARPSVPVVAVSPHLSTVRALSLVWGTYGLLSRPFTNVEDLVAESIQAALDAGMVSDEDVVVVTAGMPLGIPGTTNLIRVETVRGPILRGLGLSNGPAVTGTVWLAKDFSDPPADPYVAVVHNLSKGQVPLIERASGIIAEVSGLTSDIAVLGISSGIPTVVGVGDALKTLSEGQTVTLDPVRGTIYHGRVNI